MISNMSEREARKEAKEYFKGQNAKKELRK